LQSRIELAAYFNERKFTLGAEIGVADGRYSKILCENIPGLILTCIDPWEVYDSWRTQSYQDNAFAQACEKLKGYDVSFIRKTSLEASLEIKDNSLDFVFIDGGHCFDDVIVDIILWSRKVHKKGIVSGHDYCHFTNSGVIEAVNKYCEIHRIELNLIGRNQNNHKDDRQPTWWFVKR
jgi:hypothetical protein